MQGSGGQGDMLGENLQRGCVFQFISYISVRKSNIIYPELS